MGCNPLAHHAPFIMFMLKRNVGFHVNFEVNELYGKSRTTSHKI